MSNQEGEIMQVATMSRPRKSRGPSLHRQHFPGGGTGNDDTRDILERLESDIGGPTVVGSKLPHVVVKPVRSQTEFLRHSVDQRLKLLTRVEDGVSLAQRP